jgi:hypothetical protein
VIVGFERHPPIDRSRCQFGSLGGANEHRATLDDEVDREDVGLVTDAGCQRPSATLDSNAQLSSIDSVSIGPADELFIMVLETCGNQKRRNRNPDVMPNSNTPHAALVTCPWAQSHCLPPPSNIGT